MRIPNAPPGRAPTRLTPAEEASLGALPLPVDVSRVRIHRGGGGILFRTLRRIVLRCTRQRGIALGNHVFLPDDCCRSLPVLGHELIHCGQYQAWGPIRYYARGATERWRELLHRRGRGPSPYDYARERPKSFDAYGMEQQGQIVEDWLRGSTLAAALVSAGAASPPTAQGHSHRGPRSSP